MVPLQGNARTAPQMQQLFQGSPPYFHYPAGAPPSVRSATLPPLVQPQPGPFFRFKAGISPLVQPSMWAVRNGGTTTLG